MSRRTLRNTYFDPSKKGSFSGLSGFLKNNPVFKDSKKTKDNLHSLSTFTLHAPAKRKFNRRRVIVSGMNLIHTADLADYRKFANANGNYKYILICVDIFSKKLWTAPLKRKTGEDVEKAFKLMYKEKSIVPKYIWLDEGLEWYNARVKSLFKKLGIHPYSTKSKLKAAIAEAYVKIIKTKLARFFTHSKRNRWVDVLPKLTESINSSYNSSIKMAPNDVSKKLESVVFHNLYSDLVKANPILPKFTVSEKVRIAKHKLLTFTKGYDKNYSDEIFVIESIQNTAGAPTYKLKDSKGEKLEGSFYNEDLIGVVENSDSE